MVIPGDTHADPMAMQWNFSKTLDTFIPLADKNPYELKLVRSPSRPDLLALKDYRLLFPPILRLQTG